MENKIDAIKDAIRLLGLEEKASLHQIRKNYRKLLFQWHPDRCKEDKEICNEKTRKLHQSFKLLVAYCESYQFSFDDGTLNSQFKSDAATKFWFDRFGEDPIWS
ncbi:MAG: J domain-containing protein [Calditrichaceae bacterium]|nr:J domain-containing protein [Calditrichaceae bacterium]MBN2709298.1 J domain-containing protein [Calditrichaceae bacterium]RQV92005.1 MAG: J domain-containing protein [Calditrichota bacterium]